MSSAEIEEAIREKLAAAAAAVRKNCISEMMEAGASDETIRAALAKYDIELDVWIEGAARECLIAYLRHVAERAAGRVH
jgi:hypothetical protein